jgi:vacuolar-type H+-ATPase subunit E/Vma4
VPQWRDFLDRFRPAGTPGAAGRPAVPADRSADAAAELTSVLILLDDAQDEASRIRGNAADRAEEIRRAAQRQATKIVAEAGRRADEVRMQAEADRLRSAAAATEDMRARTDAEITGMQARAGERLPCYVDAVAAQARQWLDEIAQSAPAGSDR